MAITVRDRTGGVISLQKHVRNEANKHNRERITKKERTNERR